MILYIFNRSDSHSYKCVLMMETQNWAKQTCFGIIFWRAQVNIVNRIFWQNLSHFDVAFVLKLIIYLCGTRMCVYVFVCVYVNKAELVWND